MHVSPGPRTPLSLSRRGVLRGLAGLAVASALLGAPTPVASAAPRRRSRRRFAALALPPDGQPIVAQLQADGVEIRAYAKADSPVRRIGRVGDLLRVVGQAPGIDGDPHTWWATTEGFVQPLDLLGPAGGPAAEGWRLPEPELAAQGWWAEVAAPANVRTGPQTDAPIVGLLLPGQRVKVLGEERGGEVEGNPIWYRIDGGRYAGGRVHGSLLGRIDPPAPNTTRPDRLAGTAAWIVIDRAARTLTFLRDGTPEFVTYVAIGKEAVETRPGLYRTLHKLRSEEMSSARNPGAERSYHLPNVPHVQYFHLDGSAIHGTYWHDRYGTQESQGCVNLTVTDGAHLFGLTEPRVPEGQNNLWSVGRSTPVLIVD